MSTTKKRSRAESGESAFIGHGGRRPRVLAHGGASERSLTADDQHLYFLAKEDGEITRLRKGGGVPVVLGSAPRGSSLHYADGWLYWTQPGNKYRHADGLAGSAMRMMAEGGTPEVLVSDLPGPSCLAVSGRDLAVGCGGSWPDYFIDQDHWESCGLVVRATIGERDARTVATKQRGPCSMVFVGDQLFWANHGYKRSQYFADGSIVRMPREGGTKRTVVRRDQAMAAALIADEGYVYWTTAATVDAPVPFRPGTVVRRPREGGEPEVLVEWELEHTLMAADATHLYCLDHTRGALYRVPKGGGEPEPMMSCVERIMLCDGIVVDEHQVYWTVWSPSTAGGAVWCIAKEPTSSRTERGEGVVH